MTIVNRRSQTRAVMPKLSDSGFLYSSQFGWDVICLQRPYMLPDYLLPVSSRCDVVSAAPLHRPDAMSLEGTILRNRMM